MKKAIVLIIVIVAVGAVIAYKFLGDNQQNGQSKPANVADVASSPVGNQPSAQAKSTFYLFHDPSDQDAGCRRIYAFADQAQSSLSGRVEVKRPDVKTEKAMLEKYQVRVLPTILIVSPDGQVTERFEGEDGGTIKRLENLMARLKTAE